MAEIVSLQQRQYESIENVIAIDIKAGVDFKFYCDLAPYKLTDIVAVLARPQLVYAAMKGDDLECAVTGTTTTEERLKVALHMPRGDNDPISILSIEKLERKLTGGRL